MTLNGIQNKAMLVRLSVSQWTARRFDKPVSDKAAADFAAKNDAGRYNKILVDPQAIQPITKIVSEVRDWHYTNTLPWQDDGQRILPAANYLNYTRKMSAFKDKFNAAVAKFLDAYPTLVEDARTRLGKMWNQADYPQVSVIKNKFGFDVSVMPIPSGNDFRVSLTDTEVERIQADIEDSVKKSIDGAMTDLWIRLQTAVSNMVNRLSDKDAIFRDTLVSNLSDLVNLLPKLNLTDDPALESIRRDIEAKLVKVAPQTLRNDKEVRTQVANDAQAILDVMSGYIGSK